MPRDCSLSSTCGIKHTDTAHGATVVNCVPPDTEFETDRVIQARTGKTLNLKPSLTLHAKMAHTDRFLVAQYRHGKKIEQCSRIESRIRSVGAPPSPGCREHKSMGPSTGDGVSRQQPSKAKVVLLSAKVKLFRLFMRIPHRERADIKYQPTHRRAPPPLPKGPTG